MVTGRGGLGAGGAALICFVRTHGGVHFGGALPCAVRGGQGYPLRDPHACALGHPALSGPWIARRSVSSPSGPGPGRSGWA